MNCLVITNIFFALLFWDPYDPGLLQSSKSGFVEFLPVQEWTFSPGEKKTIEIAFMIEEGFHIQSNQVLDDNLIPTSLMMQASNEIVLYDAIFPASFPFQLINTDQVMMVFHEKLDVKIPVTTEQNIKKGNYTINGNLHYQVCDSIKCYFPRDLPFEIQIMVR